jgi:hypothetical protein
LIGNKSTGVVKSSNERILKEQLFPRVTRSATDPDVLIVSLILAPTNKLTKKQKGILILFAANLTNGAVVIFLNVEPLS